MEKLIRIGMDTSKQVFQLHGVNAAEEPILRRKLRRKEMVAFFQRLEPTVVGIEACGGAHHWAMAFLSTGQVPADLRARRDAAVNFFRDWRGHPWRPYLRL